ncbi:hypothetical protein MVEN_01596300 [Mycena venus]|uniref:Peptidase C14 caspase domain-containing protein n=1 Tax=Mycena venus TaxID=2733690 RepID=A0A8H6XQR0_9AGAR|nr:hypothetical protein MVEN_01596300 [Mycena venus]
MCIQPRPPYFLLSIAINEYSGEMPNLAGCLNDAEDFKSCLDEILGETPSFAVRSLTNSRATRSAILAAFGDHLIRNSDIQRGDPIIIYYAGHGSQATAPAAWHAPEDKVETLCPADQGMRDPQNPNRAIPGIPDVTINALLSLLAREKGTNITFVCDSCHSGGIYRNLGDGQKFSIRLGSAAEFHDPHLDSEIRRQANYEPLKFGLRGNYSSHVLLAACAADENASEDRSGTPRGLFTRALTRVLREFKPRIGVTTYSSLITSVKLPTQNPQCEGGPANCILFTGRDKLGPSVFLIRRDNDGGFTLPAGQAHGVVVGTEMTMYREASALNARGILLVQSVSPFSAKLRQTNGNSLGAPSTAWAAISRWSALTSFKIYTDFPLDFQANSPEIVYPLSVTQNECEADFTIRSVPSSPDIEMESRHVLLAPHTKRTLPLGDQQLSSVLSKIAVFHYHFRRHLPPMNLHEKGKRTTLHLYRVKAGSHGMRPASRDLFKHNVAHLETADGSDSTNDYGIKIRNSSSSNLYAYLFAFNPFDYSIGTLCMPPVGPNVQAPLKAFKSIKLGYDGGGQPFSFKRGNNISDTALFLKLIVCTENVSLHHMEQSSPLETESIASTDSRPTALDGSSRMHAAQRSELFWEASLAAIKTCPKPGFLKMFRSGLHL